MNTISCRVRAACTATPTGGEGLPPAVVAARLGQQAPDRDLLGGAAARPRNRLALTGSEQLDLFCDIAM
ncbi:hypothetical protein [Nocardia sp. NPDC047038]|uniref:hypothetical protein n=1 Tax=Nocardia sp. NPDC047038 TaxID=3154338 RepID=UPI0033C50671